MTIHLNKINGFGGESGGGGGGNIGTGDYNVKVIDYDGTIIAEKNLNEGDSFTLPKAPSHDGLVFQEWSATQDITDGKITVGKSDVMIGAIYTTASGKNEFDIELTTVTGLSVTLNIDGTKDWGDGTTDSLTSHTYSQVGKYTIKCDGTTITSSNTSGLFGQSSSSKNYYCVSVRIATIEEITAYAFEYCLSLKQITLSNQVKIIRDFCFGYCNSLRNCILPSSLTTVGGAFAYSFIQQCVIAYGITQIGPSFVSNGFISKIALPDSVTFLGAYAFAFNKTLKEIKIPPLITNCGYSFTGCHGLQKAKIPKAVATITSNLFNECYACVEYDFTEHTEVPTLQNVNNFNGINSICKIKVPSALYEDWIAEANWVTYADYIVAV